MLFSSETLETLPLAPLSAAAFELFGEVVVHNGSARRHPIPTAFDREEGAEPTLWVSRIDEARNLPIRVTEMERHPFSAQTFLPIRCCAYVVVVAGSAADGLPDLTTLRAFAARGDQGVTYRRNVWHAPLAVLDLPAEFAIVMAITGREEDTVLHRLRAPIMVGLVPQPHLQRDFIGRGAAPERAYWPNGARLAVNICINVEEGAEPSVPDGDAPRVRRASSKCRAAAFPARPAAESMFEFGSRVGYWRIDRLLAERGLPATIFGCALALERNPAIVDSIRSHDADAFARTAGDGSATSCSPSSKRGSGSRAPSKRSRASSGSRRRDGIAAMGRA